MIKGKGKPVGKSRNEAIKMHRDHILLHLLAKLQLHKRIHSYLSNKLRHKVTHSTTSTKFFPESKVHNTPKNSNRIKVGKDTHIRGTLQVFPNGGEIEIGDFCYIGHNTNIWSMSSIQIGNRVLISHGVNIIDSTSHSKNHNERHEHFLHITRKGHPATWLEIPGVMALPIIIEDDVWISFGVSILRGVRIGRGSIIAANSVVTADVPPHSLYRNQITPVITEL